MTGDPCLQIRYGFMMHPQTVILVGIRMMNQWMKWGVLLSDNVKVKEWPGMARGKANCGYPGLAENGTHDSSQCHWICTKISIAT